VRTWRECGYLACIESYNLTIGCWLTLDGAIPTTSDANLGTTSSNRWAMQVAEVRVWCVNTPVAGEDGIINTVDDRVLLTGGGVLYSPDSLSVGGEPATPSTEV